MEEMRPNSEQLLRRLKYEEEQKQTTRGKLKIFLGYAAGSGKTYTMLEAAHEAKSMELMSLPVILSRMTDRIP